jgi:hypothetical protein
MANYSSNEHSLSELATNLVTLKEVMHYLSFAYLSVTPDATSLGFGTLFDLFFLRGL